VTEVQTVIRKAEANANLSSDMPPFQWG
jgi:hypothetical protein